MLIISSVAIKTTFEDPYDDRPVIFDFISDNSSLVQLQTLADIAIEEYETSLLLLSKYKQNLSVPTIEIYEHLSNSMVYNNIYDYSRLQYLLRGTTTPHRLFGRYYNDLTIDNFKFSVEYPSLAFLSI